MIRAEGLTRYYGSFAALRDASFEIGEREIVGFLGLNGAGKSTMLKILAGLLAPTAGTVKIAGVDASLNPDVTRARIGFLPEEPPLYREMRVREFIRWVGEVKGRSRAEVDRVLPRVLETCQLQDVADRVIVELSHGYKKRVGIAQAIIHRPALLILDEPIQGLDPVQIAEMRELIRTLRGQHTILLSSHILSEVERTCDRILMLHKGRIVAQGSEQELGAAIGDGEHRETYRESARAWFTDVEVRGAREAVEKALSDIEGLTVVDVQPLADGVLRLKARTPRDAREAIANKIVGAGLGLLSLKRGSTALEDIFVRLSKDESEGAQA